MSALRSLPARVIAAIILALLAACGSASDDRVVVALTVDWEGAYLAPDGLGGLEQVRVQANAPITHFVSAAYLTKPQPIPHALATIAGAVRDGDELAIHVHAWASLEDASGIAPRSSPSFLSGTDELLGFEDDDGFDLDLDAHDVSELRALVRTSRRLLERTHLRVSTSFRAGGFLATPKVLQAIRDENFTVDSSAFDYRQLDEVRDTVLPERLHQVWPTVEATTQPFYTTGAGAPILEMPIAAVADYATPAEIAGAIESAYDRAQREPGRTVFVVLGFHVENAAEFGVRLRTALQRVHGRPGITFMTIEHAAERAREELGPPPR